MRGGVRLLVVLRKLEVVAVCSCSQLQRCQVVLGFLCSVLLQLVSFGLSPACSQIVAHRMWAGTGGSWPAAPSLWGANRP